MQESHRHISPYLFPFNYLGWCWKDWMIDLCGFWIPCGLFLLLLFSLLSPSRCPSPQGWSCLGSWCLLCSFYVFAHSALKASPSPLTTHNSSYRIYTNNTSAQHLDLALLTSLTYLNTAWPGWSTRPKNHLLLSQRLALPCRGLDSFPSSGCRALLGYCSPARAWLAEFWLYLDARTGSAVQVQWNYCPCMWSCRICSESTLYSPGSPTSSDQFQSACRPESPIYEQQKEKKEKKIPSRGIIIHVYQTLIYIIPSCCLATNCCLLQKK